MVMMRGLYINSNDGSERLFSTLIDPYDTITIESNGVAAGNTYIYSGSKKFIGLATTTNATAPTYAIGESFSLGVTNTDYYFYIVEEDVPEYTLRIDGVEVTDYENVIINGVSYKCKQVSIPTDLTGYTVTVPSGWNATSSVGMFSINFTVGSSTTTYKTLYVGGQYVEDLDHPLASSLANSIGCYNGGTSYKNISNTSSFTITITGGTAVSNSTLIQWLVDNNATFEKESA